MFRLARPGFHLDKSQCRPVKSNQIDLTLYARSAEVATDHDVTVPPQVPIGKGLAAHAGEMPGLPPVFFIRRRGWSGEAVSRRPVDHPKNEAGEDTHSFALANLGGCGGSSDPL